MCMSSGYYTAFKCGPQTLITSSFSVAVNTGGTIRNRNRSAIKSYCTSFVYICDFWCVCAVWPPSRIFKGVPPRNIQYVYIIFTLYTRTYRSSIALCNHIYFKRLQQNECHLVAFCVRNTGSCGNNSSGMLKLRCGLKELFVLSLGYIGKQGNLFFFVFKS